MAVPPPAGWMYDPAGQFSLRYWDGRRYTDHVIDKDGTARVVPLMPSPSSPSPASVPDSNEHVAVDEADHWEPELILCQRCERQFFDRRNCPLCRAPVGAYFHAPGLLRDLADGFVRLRDAAYFRIGSFGDSDLAALSPVERQQYFAAADGAVKVTAYEQQLYKKTIDAPLDTVVELLHDPSGLDEKAARLHGERFSWVTDDDGSCIGSVIEQEEEYGTVCSAVGFLDLDGYDRVTCERLEVAVDDVSITVGEVMRTFRPHGVIEEIDLRVAGGFHLAIVTGTESRKRIGGSEVLLSVMISASWPADVSETAAQEIVDDFLEGLIEGLVDLKSVAERMPRPAAEQNAMEADPLIDAIALLGLNPGYTVAEARRAYRQLAQLLHPDRHQGVSADLQQVAQQQMVRLNDAYHLARSAAELRS